MDASQKAIAEALERAAKLCIEGEKYGAPSLRTKRHNDAATLRALAAVIEGGQVIWRHETGAVMHGNLTPTLGWRRGFWIELSEEK